MGIGLKASTPPIPTASLTVALRILVNTHHAAPLVVGRAPIVMVTFLVLWNTE